ncbi:MAG: hypothetical protein C0501_03640 [Isosphaera sp.]|nr:hypothetical protein [Isosphaera sp.]
MLTDDQLRLITAAVDGELAPADREAFRALLAASHQARELHARLADDSRRLRALPVVPPPADLKARVMARVAAVPVVRRPLTRPAAPARRPERRSWAPAAVAASLLFAAGAGSFLFFRLQDGGKESAGRSPNRDLPTTGPWERIPPDPPRPAPRAVAADPRTPRDPGEVAPPVRPDPPAVAVAPDPRPVRPDILTAPPLPPVRFDLADVRVPFLRLLGDFTAEEARQQFAEELGRDPAVRVDLFTRDPSRAVGVVRDAAKSAGVALYVDATSRDRLAKGQANAVVVYTDSLTPAEAAALFGRLAAEDAKISPRVFGAAHATPVTAAENGAMKDLLGYDPGLLKRPAGGERGEKPNDPTRPLAAGTVDQVVKAVNKGEKAAVVLTWTPTTARTAPAASAELKQFLARRGERKPAAVPLLIVIRPSN